MTKCPIESTETAGLLLDYCSRKLARHAAEVLEHHMASCAKCRAFRDGQMAMWDALDQWEALPVGAGFNRELYDRIEAAESQPWWRRWLGAGTLRPALPMAMAGVFLVAGLLVQRPEAVVEPDGARAEAVEVEQVETALDDLDMLRQLAGAAKL